MDENSQKTVYRILAEALRYPFPGMRANLQHQAAAYPDEASQPAFQDFVRRIEGLSTGDWEELYTRTLDLNPAVAPYVGYQIWGDGYPRGNFMAALSRAYREAGVEADGELPDHLRCILQFLGTGATPPPELGEVFDRALEKMSATLGKTEPDNPYLSLLAAIAQTTDFTRITKTQAMPNLQELKQ